MNKSVIVYGPQGCGKTRHVEVLMRHFGLVNSQDLECLTGCMTLAPVGMLYLTCLTPEELVRAGLIDADARRVYSFDEVMSLVRQSDVNGWFARDIGDEQVQFTLKEVGRQLVGFCHAASAKAGWWNDLKNGVNYLEEVRTGTRFGKALVAEKLALVHSEVSEGLEGHRKSKMDDKLPHRTMLEVELADAIIRIADLAGAMQMDLGGAIAEKMAFNAVRPDHKLEARGAEGGKAY